MAAGRHRDPPLVHEVSVRPTRYDFDPMTGITAIAVDSLRVRRGGRLALDDLTLEVASGR